MGTSGRKKTLATPSKSLAGIPPTVGEQEEIASVLSTNQQGDVATYKKAQLQYLFRTLLYDLMAAKTCVHCLEIAL